MEKEKEVSVPLWILEDVRNALRMAYNSNEGSNCEKRCVAQSYNFINAYIKGETNDSNLERIINGYCSEKIDFD